MRSFAWIAVCLGMGLLILSFSCGKGGKGTTGPSTTPGILTVPDKAQYRPDDLTVITSDGDVDASASGEFDAPTSETSRLAIAETPDGDAYLLALLDPDDPTQRIDVTTTAVTLVFYASYLFTAPTELYDEVQNLIENTPEVSLLAQVLEERLAANSLASAVSSATVQNAVRDAVEAVEARLSTMSGVGKVVPSGPQSQVRVIHPEGNEAQIEVRNAGRRYISLYVDQTAPTSRSIVKNDLQGPASAAWSFSTLRHWIRDNRGEGEILSPSIQTFDLPITEHARNLFVVEIIGPAFKSYSGGSEHAPGYWKAWAFTALDFVVLKVLSTVVGLRFDGEALFASQTQEVAALIGFIVSELRSGQGLGKAISEGDLGGMLDGVFSMLATSHTRKLIVDAISSVFAEQIDIVQLGKMIAQMNLVIKSIKGGSAVVDLGFVGHTLITADDVETFTVETGVGPIIFQDNFDSHTTGIPPAGWVESYHGGRYTREEAAAVGVTIQVNHSVAISGKSVHFLDTNTGVGSQISHTFSPTSTLVLTYYMRTQNDEYEGSFVYLSGDGGTDYTVSFGNQDGGGQAGYIGVIGWRGGWIKPDFLAYRENTWYYVRRNLNCATDTGSFYVEEVGNSSNNASYSVGSNYSNSHINQVTISTSGSQGADCYIDELLITSDE